MIPIWILQKPADARLAESLLQRLRLDPVALCAADGKLAEMSAAVSSILTDVAKRGDEALVETSRRFDDPNFTADQIRVTASEMREAHARTPAAQLSAIRRAIAQLREYQQHVMPGPVATLKRPGVELSMRFTPVDSAGLYFPGGKAAYPSSLMHLAVPAMVAGVRRVVVVTPPSKYGRSDLVLAACHELQLTDVYRAGGAAAIAALAFGTNTIPRVDKIVGPGNTYVQLAKRLLAGAVGIDGFLGPSEVLVLADDSGHPDFIAADLLAQAEHDPGSCFLLTTSPDLARRVIDSISRQLPQRQRRQAIEKALAADSAILLHESMDVLIDWANRFAAEHVNLQVRDEQAMIARLIHAGAVFVGPYSPIAAGDYVAGPSHCLPTNTTARFCSGISVYEFLKRSSLARYEKSGLAADASAITALAEAEHLDAHAASVNVRTM